MVVLGVVGGLPANLAPVVYGAVFRPERDLPVRHGPSVQRYVHAASQSCQEAPRRSSAIDRERIEEAPVEAHRVKA